jgi:hypothetical protein
MTIKKQEYTFYGFEHKKWKVNKQESRRITKDLFIQMIHYRKSRQFEAIFHDDI